MRAFRSWCCPAAENRKRAARYGPTASRTGELQSPRPMRRSRSRSTADGPQVIHVGYQPAHAARSRCPCVRGALANPGEGVVGRVRPLARRYGAPGREGDPSSGYGWPAVEGGGAVVSPRLGGTRRRTRSPAARHRAGGLARIDPPCRGRGVRGDRPDAPRSIPPYRKAVALAGAVVTRR
jgi:hypothetical protein